MKIFLLPKSCTSNLTWAVTSGPAKGISKREDEKVGFSRLYAGKPRTPSENDSVCIADSLLGNK